MTHTERSKSASNTPRLTPVLVSLNDAKLTAKPGQIGKIGRQRFHSVDTSMQLLMADAPPKMFLEDVVGTTPVLNNERLTKTKQVHSQSGKGAQEQLQMS